MNKRFTSAGESLHPAFVLHHRPYRNTSSLLELFTPGHGRLGAVARGARGPKSKLKGLLQPFTPLLISWHGTGDLVNLTTVEPDGTPPLFTGRSALDGFYLNELLLRLLPRRDAAEVVFQCYRETLHLLADPDQEERALRLFEKVLLQELGYGLALETEAESGAPVRADQYYAYVPDVGPVAADQGSGVLVRGRSLLALARDDLADAEALHDAKRLLRAALEPQLGGKPLKSRELFRALQQKTAGVKSKG